MSVLKMKPGAKARRDGESVHHDSMDSSPHIRGISPQAGGPLSSFYSAGPVLSLKGLIQPKLTIGQPNDRYEQEADRVADQVMSIPEPKGSVAQRKSGCLEGPEKEQIQTKPIAAQIIPIVQRQGKEEEEEVIQSKKDIGGPSKVVPPIENHLKMLKGGGQSLPKSVRGYFESRFGHDFSPVKIHDSTSAGEAARSIGAKAFTTGKDIVFGAGHYSPDTSVGKQLLAHELTHVIQQRKGHPVGLQKAPTKNPCTRTILSEGTCEHLALNSKWVCCDPDKGFKRPGKKTSIAEPGQTCSSEKWTPLFTCDNTCANQLKNRCDDNDNWMAIPKNQFSRKKCNDIYTICANGKQKEGFVRDKSERRVYEVSPGIQKALGVPVGSSFKGAIYRPGAAKTIIDKDPCCKN